MSGALADSAKRFTENPDTLIDIDDGGTKVRVGDFYARVREIQAKPGWKPTVPDKPPMNGRKCAWCREWFLPDDYDYGQRFCSKKHAALHREAKKRQTTTSEDDGPRADA
jgi:hypothetical protein